MERNRHLTNLINYKIPTLLLIAPAALVMELDVVLCRQVWLGRGQNEIMDAFLQAVDLGVHCPST